MTANAFSPTRYGWMLRKSEGISWVRDEAGIILVQPDRQSYWILTGLEAALWDLMVLCRPNGEMLKLIQGSLDIRPEQAHAHLRQVILRWLDQGFIRREAESP